MPQNAITISVIIPVYNGGDDFRRCLDQVVVSIRPEDEIIVIADGDTDGSGDLAVRTGVRVIRHSTPNGPAKARNAGAAIARGDILFFVDADVLVQSDTVKQVAAVFERDRLITAIFGSYDDQPGATNFLSQYKNLLHHYVHQTGCEEATTFWSGCGAIWREIFNSIGGFNENYRRPCIEDIELGYRLKNAGHRILLDKAIQVKHLKHWNAYSLFKTDFFNRALPWTDLLLQGRGIANDLNLKYSNRLSVVLIYTFIIALFAIWWHSVALLIVGLCGAGLLLLNAPVYLFFLRKRGLFFTLLTIPWHWFYYFYSGLAFAIGLSKSFFWRPNRVSAAIPLK